jgi:hypothetical protein
MESIAARALPQKHSEDNCARQQGHSHCLIPTTISDLYCVGTADKAVLMGAMA